MVVLCVVFSNAVDCERLTTRSRSTFFVIGLWCKRRTRSLPDEISRFSLPGHCSSLTLSAIGHNLVNHILSDQPATYPFEFSPILFFLGKLWIAEVSTDVYGLLTTESEFLDDWKEIGGGVPEVPIDALAEDFCQLLVHPKSFVAPYQSVRLHGELNQQPATAMRTVIDALNAEPPENAGDVLPDHFGMQLYYAGEILLLLHDAQPNERPVIQEFLGHYIDRHLVWVPPLLHEIHKHASTKFYERLSEITSVIVQELIAVREGLEQPESS